MDEAGVPGYEVSSSNVLLAPAKTPPSIVDRVIARSAKSGGRPEVYLHLAPQGMQIVASSPEETLAAMRAESRKWGDVITATGTTINQ